MPFQITGPLRALWSLYREPIHYYLKCDTADTCTDLKLPSPCVCMGVDIESYGSEIGLQSKGGGWCAHSSPIMMDKEVICTMNTASCQKILQNTILLQQLFS